MRTQNCTPSSVIFSIYFTELSASIRKIKTTDYCRRDRMNESKVVLLFFQTKSRTVLPFPKNMQSNYLFQQCMGNPD